MSEKGIEAFIKLGQFLIVTVGFGLAGIVINYHVQQRQIELKELEQLGKFIEHAIDENVAVRQRFAEYFSDVSRSDETRERWIIYAERIASERKALEEAQRRLEQEEKLKAAKAEEANKALQAALQEKARASGDTEEMRHTLQTALLAQSQAEQETASLRLKLQALNQQLTYPEKSRPAPALNSGWVFLGTYDADGKEWSNSYFDISPQTAPEALKGSAISVATTAINVRKGIPNEFAAMAPIIGVLNQGAPVNVVEVLPWKDTGFYWARVTY